MFKFLELTDWDDTAVSQGNPLEPGQNRLKRTTDPLSPDKSIPEKDYLIKKIERANTDVVKAREKKEKAAAERASLKVLAGKRPAGEGSSRVPKKRSKQNMMEENVDSSERILDATPLQYADPNPDNQEICPTAEEDQHKETAE